MGRFLLPVFDLLAPAWRKLLRLDRVNFERAQEYIESTDLAKKVSRWHESIGPRLERVERRSAFDVHEYGTSILSKFPESDTQVTKAAEMIKKCKKSCETKPSLKCNQGCARYMKFGSAIQIQDTGSVSKEPQNVSLV